MSNTDIRVVPGPANYFSHPGSLAHLNDFFTPEQLSRAVWIYGERAIEAARPFLPASFDAPGAKHLLFKGHCSERDVSHLVNEAGSDVSVVIGIGGGAVMDTVKAVARRSGVPFVGIPTIAATCAAWTPLSVWYNDEGQALQFEIFDDANFLVLVEPQIVLNAPAEYLLAGIGDTLAKWYEALRGHPAPAYRRAAGTQRGSAGRPTAWRVIAGVPGRSGCDRCRRWNGRRSGRALHPRGGGACRT